MPPTFEPRLDILPPAQRQLWDELGATPEAFTLYGGTAIALHLGHRQSVDFDFFGTEPFDPRGLIRQVPYLAQARIEQVEPNTLTVSVDRGDPVKLSFFGLPGIGRVATAHIAPLTGLKVAALIDLGGMKASVVQVRAEAKDYLDIEAMLASGQIDLATLLAAGRAIYGAAFEPQSTLKALTFYADGNLADVPMAIRERLVEAVRKVDLDRLPQLAAQAGP